MDLTTRAEREKAYAGQAVTLAAERNWSTTLSEQHLVLGIGELLWDVLPQGLRLGGAPANFAVMAGRLGNHAAILSRIGRDDLGRKAVG